MRLPWLSRRRHEAALGEERAEVNRWRRRYWAADTKNRRVREAVALHQPVAVHTPGRLTWDRCEQCKKPHPCPTVRAAGLDEEATG